jgi:ribulose kinase
MSIATDILSLRQNQSSSVETLMAKIEWLKAAEEEAHISSRSFGVREAADLVFVKRCRPRRRSLERAAHDS